MGKIMKIQKQENILGGKQQKTQGAKPPRNLNLKFIIQLNPQNLLLIAQKY